MIQGDTIYELKENQVKIPNGLILQRREGGRRTANNPISLKFRNGWVCTAVKNVTQFKICSNVTVITSRYIMIHNWILRLSIFSNDAFRYCA